MTLYFLSKVETSCPGGKSFCSKTLGGVGLTIPFLMLLLLCPPLDSVV